jgi:hypothetical protein
VILLRAFLVAQAPGRRRRTEVGAAIAASGRRTAGSAGTARAETSATARPWSTEPTAAAKAAASATTGSWAAEAATARARPEAGSGWTWTAILAGTRFADCERPALKRLGVELANDFFRLLAVRKLDERKSAWAPGLSIDRHGDVGRLCDGCEVGAEIHLARTIREVPDEQTDCQGLLVKSPLSAAGFDSISKTR